MKSKEKWSPKQYWWEVRFRLLSDAMYPQHSDGWRELIVGLAVPETCRWIVEHLGVETVLVISGKLILDQRGDYTLLRLDDPARLQFLKMKNPSTGQWHLEAVHPGCTTVEEALNWRNSGWFKHADKLT